MYVLGISCFYHDAAAALLRDGMLIAAAEEERFSRRKHDSDFPGLAIAFCLDKAGIKAQDLDYVVFYERPHLKFERIVSTTLGNFPRAAKIFAPAMSTWLGDKLWIKSTIRRRLGIPQERILFTDHHVAHAASALLCSPFEEAAILTADGVGEWTTTAIGSGSAPLGAGPSRLDLSDEIRFPHSLGLLYSVFTDFLGFEVNEGEYKVMGMAAYGEPRYVEQVRKVIDARPDGSFHLELRYFAYQHSATRGFSGQFVELFGEPRDPDAEFITRASHPGAEAPTSQMERCQYYADVAASVQLVVEEIMLSLAREAHRRTGKKNLVMAGGVALNCVANGRILREGPFDELFIQPAAGDSGGALGAALYVSHVVLGEPRRFVMEHAYWGQSFSRDETVRALEDAGAAYEVIEDASVMTGRVVERLVAGDVVGWFEGGFEWGPRALGHRSILADPRRAEMKDIVNRKIKFREPFRPFAPAVPIEDAATYFDMDEPARHYPARFMLLVAGVRPEHQSTIPAVNHQGTARLQAVRSQESPRYHQLIRAFGDATGVPVLMNTSFNVRGEPIVTTPAQALDTFRRSDMEVLVLDDVLVRRAAQRA